ATLDQSCLPTAGAYLLSNATRTGSQHNKVDVVASTRTGSQNDQVALAANAQPEPGLSTMWSASDRGHKKEGRPFRDAPRSHPASLLGGSLRLALGLLALGRHQEPLPVELGGQDHGRRDPLRVAGL